MRDRTEYFKKYRETHKIEKHNWYIQNKEKILKKQKLWRDANRTEYRKRRREWSRNNPDKSYLKNNPWIETFYKAKARCEDTKHPSYKNYGARGIKVLMVREDFKTLWFRDGASEMKRPEIHRKNNDGDYTFDNCEYKEGKEHRQIHRRKHG